MIERDNKEVQKLVKASWNSNNNCPVKSRIDRCRPAISKWIKENHKNNQEAILVLKRRLEEEMSSPNGSAEVIQTINRELKEVYQKEEMHWKQRSRVLWLTLGDKNSHLFHTTTRGRRTINKLATIDDNEGQSHQDEDQILRVISSYFQDLFATQGTTDYESIDGVIQRKITEDQNKTLTAEPTAEDIRDALFSIHPDRAPGPDGFSSCFFQSNWQIVGPAIIRDNSSSGQAVSRDQLTKHM